MRRGVGMALFSYKTGVWPISLEISGARLVLNQDGSVQLQTGAAEIGQGSDTVFTQMAAEVLGISPDDVHIQSFQDTDITPFDTGAYASRQTYISGTAVKECAELLREKILTYARTLVAEEYRDQELSLYDKQILCGQKPILSLEELALNSYYSRTSSAAITSDVSRQIKKNTLAFGACFAEIEVDLKRAMKTSSMRCRR